MAQDMIQSWALREGTEKSGSVKAGKFLYLITNLYFFINYYKIYYYFEITLAYHIICKFHLISSSTLTISSSFIQHKVMYRGTELNSTA